MNRRKFVKSCCVGTTSPMLITMLQSCGVVYYASAVRDGSNLVVNKSEFLTIRKDKVITRKYVLIQIDSMDYPICLYNTGTNEYTASLLKCTHRGCELNVGAGMFTCPCHGSEFSNEGKVIEGPAIENLRTFKTNLDNENIYILQS